MIRPTYHDKREDSFQSEAASRAGLTPPCQCKPTTSYTADVNFSAMKKRQQRESAGWSINKLRFEDLGIHGREEELKLMHKCLERILSKQSTSELILIDGFSGTGKSTLSMTLKKPMNKLRNGIFAKGKYGFEIRDRQPFGGIIEVCQEICTNIIEMKNIRQQHIYDKIRKALLHSFSRDASTRTPNISGRLSTASEASSSVETERPIHGKFQFRRSILQGSTTEELACFLEAIPGLRQIMGNINTSTDSAQGHNLERHDSMRTITRSNRLQDFIIELFRIVTSSCELVIVLDDLQYADLSSLDFLEHLLSEETKQKLSSILIIGLYRSNEIDNSHTFARVLRNIKASYSIPEKTNVKPKVSSSGFHITEISLRNLQIPAVNRILSDLLSLDDESQTLGLAQICWRRTNGNPFFFVSFIIHLKEMALLQYNIGLMRWTWSESTIEAKTMAAINVVDLIKTKMNTQLDASTTQILQLAACLGTSFEERLISVLWDELGRQSHGRKSSTELLQVATDEFFLESRSLPSSSVLYRWVHDSIQEAAMCLVDPEIQTRVKYQAGKILVDKLSRSDLDSSLFVVCNLLNSGPMPEEREERILIAELNLQAAKKATKFCAFGLAQNFACQGIDVLPKDDCWKLNNSLCIDLYSTAVELENIIGRVDQMEEHANILMNQPESRCSVLEKSRVYCSWIDSISNRGRVSEARDLCLKVLEKLGCSFPSGPLGYLVAARGLRRLQRQFKRFETIVATEKGLDTIDSRTYFQLKLLDKLGTVSYTPEGSRTFPPLIGLQIVRLIYRKGINEFSPLAFTLAGVMTIDGLSDFETGVRFGRLSLALVERYNLKAVEARCFFIVHCFIVCWVQPFRSCLKPLMRAYETGLQTGDNESATRAFLNHCYFGLFSGKPLDCIAQDINAFVKQIVALKKVDGFFKAKALMQFILALMGGGCFTNDVLVEEMLNDADFLKNKELGGQQPVFFKPYVDSLKSMSYAYFGEHNAGAEFAVTKGDSAGKGFKAHALSISHPFYKALSLASAAGAEAACPTIKKRRYKREATRMYKLMKKWERKGNPNVQHQVSMIKALLLILEKENEKAKEFFQRAIFHASRGGIIHEAALLNERCAYFSLHVLNDHDEARYRINEAVRLYSEWGARKKVDLLRETWKIH